MVHHTQACRADYTMVLEELNLHIQAHLLAVIKKIFTLLEYQGILFRTPCSCSLPLMEEEPVHERVSEGTAAEGAAFVALHEASREVQVFGAGVVGGVGDGGAGGGSNSASSACRVFA